MSYMLRELSRDDLAEITKWRNDPDLIQWLASPFRYIDKEVDATWFNSYLLARSNNVRLAICSVETGSIAGVVYLLGIDWINRHAEFSILIGDESARGTGIGRFAANGMLRHAFCDLNLHRVSLDVLANNDRAIKLYRKIGFVEEGRARQAIFKNSKYIDLIQMAILAEEFQTRASQKEA